MLHVVSAQGPMHPSTTFTWNRKGGSKGYEALGELEAPGGWLGMQLAQESPLYDSSFCRDKVRKKELWKGKSLTPEAIDLPTALFLKNLRFAFQANILICNAMDILMPFLEKLS